jgi:hypothetical protein
VAIVKIQEILPSIAVATSAFLYIFQYIQSFTQESIVAPDTNVIVAICSGDGRLPESMN